MASAADARSWAPDVFVASSTLCTPRSAVPAASAGDQEALRGLDRPLHRGAWTTMGSGSVASSASAGR